MNTALKTRGIKTWFDGEQMKGNIVDQMTKGIDNSVCSVVCITKNYEAKVGGRGARGLQDNCKIEYNYALNHQGVERMIPVVMESRMANPSAWRGALGAAFGSILYKVNLGNVRADVHDGAFNKQMDILADEIISVCKTANATIRPDGQASSKPATSSSSSRPTPPPSTFSRYKKWWLLAGALIVLIAAVAGAVVALGSSGGGGGDVGGGNSS
eukprot:9471064-Pyramimonas_sp.AAC.1